MPSISKPSKFQKDQMILKLVDHILSGKTTPQIYALERYTFGKNGRAIGERGFEHKMQKAREILRNEINDRRTDLYETTLARIEDLYRDSKLKGDGRLALDALKEEAKLADLYSPDKVEQTVRIISVPGDEEV